VVLGDVDIEAGEAAAAEIAGAQFVRLDVSSEASWREAAEAIARTHKRVDILINNAAILFYGSIAETPVAELQRMMAVNLEGTWLGIQAMLPLFGEDGGAIVNIASIAGLMGRPDQAAYLTSKWALRGLGRAASLELAPRRIRVNTIFPGLIATEMSEGRYGADGVAAMGAALPAGRAGTPDDIADMVLFLASPRSGFITGAEFVCDGGATAGMS
jgi:NAD(P)-dependent dehydrogenase (short-subunit alcohol dehydrogenase family)